MTSTRKPYPNKSEALIPHQLSCPYFSLSLPLFPLFPRVNSFSFLLISFYSLQTARIFFFHFSPQTFILLHLDPMTASGNTLQHMRVRVRVRVQASMVTSNSRPSRRSRVLCKRGLSRGRSEKPKRVCMYVVRKRTLKA